MRSFFSFLMALAVLITTGFYSFGALADSTQPAPRLRISLLTCGVGGEAWETFGHTGVHVIDSDNTGPGGNVVFNYGMFNGFDKDFELNFMKGKLLYYVGIETFSDFMSEYIEANRTVWEQIVNMRPDQKLALYQALRKNTLPENRYYKYDFFFDNCATRIRDIFPATLNPGFRYGPVIDSGERITFRDIINRYFYYKHWTRVGVNILLGSKIDRPMTSSDIMFLPDFLSKGLQGATVEGLPISSKPEVIIKGLPPEPVGTDEPLFLFWTIALLTVAGIAVRQLYWLGRVMSSLLLFATGLLGILILVMWFGTNHQTCADNYNLLWLLPTNLILLVSKPKGRGRYALMGIGLIFVTLLLHIFRVQQITIKEVSPLLLSMCFVYAGIYYRTLGSAMTKNGNK